MLRMTLPTEAGLVIINYQVLKTEWTSTLNYNMVVENAKVLILCTPNISVQYDWFHLATIWHLSFYALLFYVSVVLYCGKVPPAEVPDEELPQLGAEEVIDEVVTLLGRLESDRQDTEDSLEKEKKRVVWLQGKIDRLAQKRLVELPKAVQKGRISYKQ